VIVRRLLVLLLVLVSLAAGSATAFAQSNWREVAVAAYTVEAYARGAAIADDQRARRFAEASMRMREAMAAACAAPAVDAAAMQASWRASVSAWDTVSSLSTGPLVERRSARQIDFMPARPAAIERAIEAAPAGLADLDRIGAPARGFAALEGLLWNPPALSASRCRYAALLAADIDREAQALAAGFAQLRQQPVDDEAALARLVDSVNQWVGGVELLRWAWMRKPQEVAATRGEAPDYPRRSSGQTVAAWAARWLPLRDAAVLGSRERPVAGEAPLPFETLLRGRGLNPLADRLVAATARADAAMQGLEPAATDRVRDAAAALGELSKLAQDELAPALGVRLGFSDADGD
jgi:uncharacterized protein